MLESLDPLEVVAAGHLAQPDAVGEPRRPSDLRRRRDHDGLLLLGHEPGRPQPLRQVVRPVVAVQLPLEALAALPEDAHLPFDQRVELDPVEALEVAIEHEAAVAEPGEADERPVALDVCAGRQRVGDVCAELRVVRCEQVCGVRH